MVYYFISSSFNHFIEGDVAWFDENWERFCFKNKRNRFELYAQSALIDMLSTQIKPKLPKGVELSMLNYGFLNRIAVDVASDKFIERFSDEVRNRYFRFGRIICPDNSSMDGWRTFVLNKDAVIRDSDEMGLNDLKSHITNNNQPFYSCYDYEFIVRADSFLFDNKIRNLKIKEVEI